MKSSTLLILLAGVIAFMFLRQSSSAPALPAPASANPTGGAGPGGSGNVFADILGLLTAGVDAAGKIWGQNSARTA